MDLEQFVIQIYLCNDYFLSSKQKCSAVGILCCILWWNLTIKGR